MVVALFYWDWVNMVFIYRLFNFFISCTFVVKQKSLVQVKSGHPFRMTRRYVVETVPAPVTPMYQNYDFTIFKCYAGWDEAVKANCSNSYRTSNLSNDSECKMRIMNVDLGLPVEAIFRSCYIVGPAYRNHSILSRAPSVLDVPRIYYEYFCPKRCGYGLPRAQVHTWNVVKFLPVTFRFFFDNPTLSSTFVHIDAIPHDL